MCRQRPVLLRLLRWALFAALTALSLGCSGKTTTPTDSGTPETESGPTWFEDVTEQVGLDFQHDAGPTGTYFMPQIMGAGGAFFDLDGDGLLDIYLLQCGGPKATATNRLYRQRANGSFEDISAGSGLDVVGYNMGVAIGDVNNDGRPDVLLTQYGGSKLFLNLGNGRFKDVSAECGLRNPLWGTSAAFFDYDRDGWLDLVIANYLDYDPSKSCISGGGVADYCSPKNFPGSSSKLFRNRGADGARTVDSLVITQFEDRSLASGVSRVPGPGLGVVAADFDGDGWPDLFIANDAQPNRLWINKKNGTFNEEAVSRNVAYTFMGQAYAGMGIALGDIDNDLLLDLYVTHLGGETNTLWKQGPRGLFTDKTGDSGLLGTRWRGTGFGTLFADFDNNGLLDIAIVNGGVQRGTTHKNTGLGFWEPYAERNQLLENAGSGKFRDISSKNDPLCRLPNVARGLIRGDFNNDGAEDLLVTTIGGKARLYKNVAPNRGHWLKLRVVDPQLQRDAYGAEIVVRAGDKHWLRLANPADSYLSSGSPIVHFGLGAVSTIDAIEVLWPDGSREQFAGGAVDRQLLLTKGNGRKLGS